MATAMGNDFLIPQIIGPWGERGHICPLAPISLNQKSTPLSLNSPELLDSACMGIELVLMVSPCHSTREALGREMRGVFMVTPLSHPCVNAG